MKVKRESEVAQSCLTLSDPMDCSLPGSSVHGIFQARVLEWGAIALSDKNRQDESIHRSLAGGFLLRGDSEWTRGQGACWGEEVTLCVLSEVRENASSSILKLVHLSFGSQCQNQAQF